MSTVIDVIAAPPSQMGCPSFSRSPLLITTDETPSSTPTGSPAKKALETMDMYLEEMGHLRKFDPEEAWLPITESRNGNVYYAAFHILSSGIGFQALLLPLAFHALGWYICFHSIHNLTLINYFTLNMRITCRKWGISWLSLTFVWQLYTLWLLIQLHESSDGTRYSRYLRLSMAAFGERLGKVLSLFPIMYLSGGTCVTLIMLGGGSLKIFFQIVSGSGNTHGVTTVEWYLIFTFSAILVAHLLPNLNSVSWVSLIGAITAVGYCSMIWVVSVCKGRPVGWVQILKIGATWTNKNSGTVKETASGTEDLDWLSLGIIAFAFRGHNLVLEIQGTMQTSKTKPSRLTMWRGAAFSYLIIGVCFFPLAICGYWAYGNLIHVSEGIPYALYEEQGHEASKLLIGSISLLIVVNSLSSFQIYAMPVFDNLEMRYTSRMKKPCPRWVRVGIRCFFGCLALFISIAFPFLPSLAGLIGGVAVPVTLVYPCLMWVKLKKPRIWSVMWWVNWGLGCFGVLISLVLVVAAVWRIVLLGIPLHFLTHDKKW